MSERLLRGPESLPYGYTSIAEMGKLHPDMHMDFGLLKLQQGEVFTENQQLERLYLLITGEVEFAFLGAQYQAARPDCFDHSPWVLHVPAGVDIRITGLSDGAELSVHRTDNEKIFDAKLYRPEDIPDEIRGKNTMRETGTRTVRTVLDKSLAPWSNFVFGEVITYPGKWSSYPPHIHPQPENYYYRLLPENGYGFCEYGDDVYKVRNHDTVFIEPNYTHPQVAGPGYAMWYMWIIRQIEEDPYEGVKYPHFIEEHNWARQKDADIWEPQKR